MAAGPGANRTGAVVSPGAEGKSREFDLLFSDLRMPLLNGPELHARLLEIRPELVRRMAFVTGDTMGDQMGEFLKRAGRPILEKPFTKAGVRAVLAALIVAEGER